MCMREQEQAQEQEQGHGQEQDHEQEQDHDQEQDEERCGVGGGQRVGEMDGRRERAGEARGESRTGDDYR